MIVETKAHSTTSRANRVKIPLAGLGLLLATFLTFAFSLPLLVGASVALGVILAIMFPEWALYLYAASLFLFQVPALEGTTISIPTITGALFLAVACFHRLRNPEKATTGWRILVLIGIISVMYLAAALLNLDWTFAHPRGTCTYMALFAVTLAAAYELRNPARAWRVSWIFCAGSGLVAIEAIYENWTGHYNLVGLFPGQEARAYGLADPNYTAAFLVTLLPFMVAHFVRTQHTYVKTLMAALTTLSLVGLAMTASRGGAAGCILVIVAVMLFVPFKKKRASGGDGSLDGLLRFAWGRAGLLALLLCTTGIAAYLAPQNLWDRLSTMDELSDTRKEDRLRIWQDYLDRWRESPWVGKGAGFLEERDMEPHNTPLQNLVEVGVLGSVGFLLLNAFAVWEALTASRRFALQGTTDMAALSGAVAAALVGFHSTGFFLTSAKHKELWFLIGFAAALSHVSRSSRSSKQTVMMRFPLATSLRSPVTGGAPGQGTNPVFSPRGLSSLGHEKGGV
jgi:O-antigen ligase